MKDNTAFPAAGSPIDLAPFGKVIYFYGTDPRKREFVEARMEDGAYLHSEPDENGCRHLCLMWDDPRDIYSVAVTYANGAIPNTDKVEVQYWQLKWPYGFRDETRGAHRGWIRRDDQYRGNWVTALSKTDTHGACAMYNFHHLDITELTNPGYFEHIDDLNAEYRCALKFRLLFPKDVDAKVTKIEAFTRGEWQAGEVDAFGVGEASVDAYNGYVTSVERHDDALNVKYLYVPVAADDFPHRRTVITVRDAEHPFSFCASDIVERPLYIEDFGVLIRPAGDSRAPETIVDQLIASGTPSIYDRVFDEPEQTFERAMREIPRLRAPFQYPPIGRYCPLGCEGSKQRFALRYNGSFFVDKRMNKAMGKDIVGQLWSGLAMHYKFASGDFPNFREYENACKQSWSPDGAPVITSVWVDRDIEYTQTAFAAYFREDMGEFLGKKGSEDVVLLMRFEIRNIAHDARKAHLWLQSSPYERIEYANSVLSANGRVVFTEKMFSDELATHADTPNPPRSFNWVVKDYSKPLTRCRIDLGKGCGYVTPLSSDREVPTGVPTAFHYQADLKGGERDVITFVVPYCTVTDLADMHVLGLVDYNAKLRDVTEFWTPYVDSGMKIVIPDKMIEEFYRKVPVHVAITATKDPGSGHYMVPAATFGYDACGNEAIIQIRQLDYRGHHKQAEKYLDGLLLVQSAYSLDGNFQTEEGALAGISFYDGKPLSAPFSYNTDHGFILWSLSEHYFITRDKQWITRVADNIIAGCDFITRERQATKIECDGVKVPEYGLMPAGHLEDNDEWRYWCAVNAHAHLGIKWASEVLAEIDHPEAARLAKDAEEFKCDILASVERARIESPVMTLFDNTSVPHIPVRTDIRGPEWGWFREGAYGPLHLVDGGVLEPTDERVTWVMKYLEDLVYPSRDRGRPIDLEKYWFSQAGLTIQANLLNNGVAYVRRDEPKHAVRALFNDFAASIYDDVLIFTEHPVVQLSRGIGPYYKTPDECGFLNLLRACMVWEEKDTLFLAKAAPRSWFTTGETVEIQNAATFFGPVSYTIKVAEDTMEACIEPPRRNPPTELAVHLRRADGKVMKLVTVNGKPHSNFDPKSECVRVKPAGDAIVIRASY